MTHWNKLYACPPNICIKLHKNESILKICPVQYDLESLVYGIRSGEIRWLSRGITLVESTLAAHQILAGQLMDRLIQTTSQTLRVGITGVPGVGKSTFIEKYGLHLVEQGKRLAVLSVDPTSTRTRGSIMGDKTRMDELSQHPRAYIRPSPSGTTLGGVAEKTREAMLLCEAAGFDTIIVETVGVGQSETAVKEMVDFFLLLLLPTGGDELQGIKRGIMEMADGIFINKADTDPAQAKRAQMAFEQALHLYPLPGSGQKVQVGTCSALTGLGLEDVSQQVATFIAAINASGWFEEQRNNQQIHWFHSLLRQRWLDRFFQDPQKREEIKKAEEKISSAQWSIRTALDHLTKNYS